MGWGGETMGLTQRLRREIHKSNKEVKALGIIHEDLRPEMVDWCEELGQALIIDFHRSTLRYRPAKQRKVAILFLIPKFPLSPIYSGVRSLHICFDITNPESFFLSLSFLEGVSGMVYHF